MHSLNQITHWLLQELKFFSVAVVSAMSLFVFVLGTHAQNRNKINICLSLSDNVSKKESEKKLYYEFDAVLHYNANIIDKFDAELRLDLANNLEYRKLDDEIPVFYTNDKRNYVSIEMVLAYRDALRINPFYSVSIKTLLFRSGRLRNGAFEAEGAFWDPITYIHGLGLQYATKDSSYYHRIQFGMGCIQIMSGNYTNLTDLRSTKKIIETYNESFNYMIKYSAWLKTGSLLIEPALRITRSVGKTNVFESEFATQFTLGILSIIKLVFVASMNYFPSESTRVYHSMALMLCLSLI